MVFRKRLARAVHKAIDKIDTLRSMVGRQRLVVLVAGLVSVPLVALALAGAGYIAYSLIADAWYRDIFWAYGTKLLLLYILFIAGISSAAAIAMRYPHRYGRTLRLWLLGACVAGFGAALFLELQFWSDSDPLLWPGLLLLPFVGWVLVALTARPAT